MQSDEILAALRGQYNADVASEVVARMLALPSWPTRPLHWARRVARRLSIDETRRQQRAVRLSAPEWVVQAPEQEVLAMARECLRALPRKVIEDELALTPLTSTAKTRRRRAVQRVKKGEYL